ncbi:hypothetical protein [Spiroplasma turonicum]|uniref:Uncharacterized protein n=1 Tax=Spiroplasma turonicum TaxID=216946 RepID=A0A0K1P6I2_9MOLU|nr:hypothetical protein [Spiroplasma turonicum]AKU79890.1 hypothetical protein STURON_00644 [Spiroplasma turonicum]ALX70901.1 hypothetical protein STURO_v1c06420 [Spiroplasma turonicum]
MNIYLIIIIFISIFIIILLTLLIFQFLKNKKLWDKYNNLKNLFKEIDKSNNNKFIDESYKSDSTFKEFFLNKLEYDIEIYKSTQTNYILEELRKTLWKNKNFNKLIKWCSTKIELGENNNSKFIMTLSEFLSNTGWIIIMCLIACCKLKNVSSAEKKSWFANYGPLVTLFFHESNKTFLKNTWLIFEKEIKNSAFKPRPYRPDLILLTKTSSQYNLLFLELKQWSSFDELNIKDFDKKYKHLYAQLKNYINNSPNSSNKLNINKIGLSYLFNLNEKVVNKFNKEDLKQNYSFENKKELLQRIYMFLTNSDNIVENISIEELNNFFKNW